ncbi:MAG: c-type cytochrome [bacterium]|nr:c-type cytochrome [bacterium]
MRTRHRPFFGLFPASRRRALPLAGLAALFLFGILALFGNSPADEPSRALPPPPPLGLDDVPVPDDNPMTRPKVELGRMLFFEKRISGDGTVSCHSCHNPKRGLSSGKQYGTGIGGKLTGVNPPTVWNAAYFDFQFWDGRAKSLEEQAAGPITHPGEMGATKEHVVRVLNGIPGYRLAFKKAFGTEEVTFDKALKAIATFERTLISGDSPFDQWKFSGDKLAISEDAKKGFALFNDKAKCVKCHLVDAFSAPFTDNKFHNVGIGMEKSPPEEGRAKVTGQKQDLGKFKTPTLRLITLTAPYMHDGRFRTLAEVVDFYDKGGTQNPNLDPDIKPLSLTPEEKKHLIAFLRSLTGTVPSIRLPDLPK